MMDYAWNTCFPWLILVEFLLWFLNVPTTGSVQNNSYYTNGFSHFHVNLHWTIITTKCCQLTTQHLCNKHCGILIKVHLLTEVLVCILFISLPWWEVSLIQNPSQTMKIMWHTQGSECHFCNRVHKSNSMCRTEFFSSNVGQILDAKTLICSVISIPRYHSNFVWIDFWSLPITNVNLMKLVLNDISISTIHSPSYAKPITWIKIYSWCRDRDLAWALFTVFTYLAPSATILVDNCNVELIFHRQKVYGVSTSCLPLAFGINLSLSSPFTDSCLYRILWQKGLAP